MIGFIIDQSGSLDSPFYMVGAMETVGGVAFYFIAVIQKKMSGNKPEYEAIPETKPITRHRRISEAFA